MREASPEHSLKSLEERSEEDGVGKECNFYIVLQLTVQSFLNIHQSESLVRWVAEREEIAATEGSSFSEDGR
jgi:aspartate/methionine/tyrosine aminotransferase